jgi:hypothetical protein
MPELAPTNARFEPRRPVAPRHAARKHATPPKLEALRSFLLEHAPRRLAQP